MKLKKILRWESEKWEEKYLYWLALVLLGYTALGRGFAGLGVPPLYVGEVSLILGLLLLPAALSRFLPEFGGARTRLVKSVLLTLSVLILWMLLGAAQTVPGILRYGVVALRDAVLWAYGFFSLIIFALLAPWKQRLTAWLQRYRVFVLILPLWIPIIQAIYWTYWEKLPRVPDSDVRYLFLKPSDLLVHLAGIAAYITMVYYGNIVSQMRIAWSALTAIDAIILIPISRSGFVAFTGGLLTAFVLRPRNPRLAVFVALLVLVFMFLALTGLEIEATKGRTISAEQIAENTLSLVGLSLSDVLGGRGDTTSSEAGIGADTEASAEVSASSGGYSLEGTLRWRLDWWREIVDYTILGEYFWFGKGFGVNLAEDDGFAVAEFPGLRSPHNGHLTVLARMGVPGFLLWVLFQGLWGLTVLRSYFLSRSRKDLLWSGTFLFIIVYWVAMILVASFDVYLEGPMGGIWFWCIIGLGVAAAWAYAQEQENVARLIEVPGNS